MIKTSWDDGHILDLNIAGYLKRYNVPGIFYIPNCGDLEPRHIVEIHKMGFEIGGHTVRHPNDLKMLSDHDLKDQIVTNKKWLEDIIGEEIKSFAYPRGRYDERVMKAVEAAGFENARTTKVLEFAGDNPFCTPTTLHVFQRSEYGDVPWDNMASKLFNQYLEVGGTYHLWGHAKEVYDNKNVKRLEAVLNKLNAYIRTGENKFRG